MRRSCGAAAALLLLLVALPNARAGNYDPCSTSTSKVTKGDGGHAIGLAFWINGLLSDWDPEYTTVVGNVSTVNTTSLHPCTNKAYLSSINAPINVTVPSSVRGLVPSLWQSMYTPQTDQMAVLYIDVTQQDTLMSTYTRIHANDTVNVTYMNVTGGSSMASTTACGSSLFDVPGVNCDVNITGRNVSYYSLPQPANNSAQFVSMVAFYGSGSNAVRSLPRYQRSLNSTLTLNTGVVTQLILIARYSAGKLTYLTWADMGCSGCGGPNDERCMYVGVSEAGTEAFACAQTNATCSVYESGSAANSTNATSTSNATSAADTTSYSPCAFGVYLGFSGSDQYGKPFKSGPQIEMLRKYSVSKLGSSALGYARTAGSYVKSQVPSEVATTSTSNTQLGRRRR